VPKVNVLLRSAGSSAVLLAILGVYEMFAGSPLAGVYVQAFYL
jgi:hypothetical protein